MTAKLRKVACENQSLAGSGAADGPSQPSSRRVGWGGMKRRGQIVALSTAAVGVVVLAVAGIAGKDRIREEWYVWRLEAGSREQKIDAAHTLRRMDLARAIPALCRAITPSDPEGAGIIATAIVCSRASLFSERKKVGQVGDGKRDGRDLVSGFPQRVVDVLRIVSESGAFTEADRRAAVEALMRIQAK